MSKWLNVFLPAKAAVPHARASNEQFKPVTRPVGVFLGGTSGIGQAMAEQLARHTNGQAQIVLLGRNQDAADKIIASLPRTPDGTPAGQESKYSFVKVDATSMAQVREVTSKLANELDKINFLVLSSGFLTMKGRDETSEGIDRKLACNFYSRFRFAYDLAPLVEKAAEKGERTGVMSVLDAGKGGPVNLNDLGLVKGFSLSAAHDHAVTGTDAAYEEFATRYPKIPFTHAYPGAVSTPMVTNFTGSRFLVPLVRPLLVTPEHCAQIMWWRLWSPEEQWKTGAHQVNNHGEEVPHNRFVTPEVRTAVWEHAIQMTGEKSE
ncbi:hypothetical protein M408DRAFT_81264 [Serendipita vermifera MAFF 305830]|uniref:Ketoreductase (KR) domain-containing protein n=1 Tax=Serendipita vermifera MAFF 305830 TaxID=933852 RepID=A0A0C2W366_SERVB|nr:hypothetical protein M408DRAFT_81264 [Serendipita vermifera MAFF 305830]